MQRVMSRSQLRECGNHRRVETWENANLQAGIFARHVMGVEHPDSQSGLVLD